MGSMFENYENLNSQYIPSNITKAPIKCQDNCACSPLIPNKPYEDYNARGQLVGYWWNYGDTINLDFNLSGYVTTDNAYITVQDFIRDKQINIQLYNFRHEEIVNELFDGNDFTNLVYNKVSVNPLTQGIYYIYDNETGKYQAVDLPEQYNKDTIYYEGVISVVFPINEQLSKALTPGTYYCSLNIIGEDLVSTVFYEDSCTLTVR